MLYGIGMALLILLEIMLHALDSWVGARLDVEMRNRFRSRFFGLLLQSEWQGKERYHSGDVLNRMPMMTAENDEWAHTIELTNAESTDTALNDLLAQIIVHTGELKAFAERGIKVQLRMYVQSDYAQMSYRLMPETLSRLVATGLPLEVSSMSWGELGI